MDQQHRFDTTHRFAWLLVLITFSVCIRHAQVNSNCEWIGENTARPLDLSRASARHHLNDDALFAEDLAIRFADVYRGHRSGGFQGIDAYRDAREQCMARLDEAVAALHHVDSEQVREAVLQRSMRYEIGVIVSFLLLYGLVSARIAKQIIAAFQQSGPWLAAFALVAIAVPLGGVGLLSAELWSSLAEMVRLGNDHLSYRSGRTLLPQNPRETFFACVALFWLAAAFRYRRYLSLPPGSSSIPFHPHETHSDDPCRGSFRLHGELHRAGQSDEISRDAADRAGRPSRAASAEPRG